MPQLPRIATDRPATADLPDPIVPDPVPDPVSTHPVVPDPAASVAWAQVVTAALDALAETTAELSLDAGTLQEQRAVRDALDRLHAAALEARP